MISVGLLASWVIMLPWCFGVNEFKVSEEMNDWQQIVGSHHFETILNQETLVLNGKRTSLRAIYDDILPTPDNFKIGKNLVLSIVSSRPEVITHPFRDVGTMCPAGIYVERSFSYLPLSTDHSASTSTMTDTPTAIARKIAMEKQAPPVVLLKGNVLAGKSVSLAKIQNELQYITPSSWIIRVDISPEFQTSVSFEEMTFEYIVQKVVAADHLDFFYNLLEINAKRIVFLFDGVEHMVGNRASKLAFIIKTIVEKNAVVVLTGRENTAELLRHHQVTFDVYKIGEMTIQETKKYLTNIWNREVKRSIYSQISRIPLETRLNDYVEIFVHTLFKTPLPRYPGLLLALTKTFNSQFSDIFMPTTNTDSVGCIDYMYIEYPSPSKLLSAMEQVVLNKYALYEKFVEYLTVITKGISNDPMTAYSVVALVQSVSEHETPENANIILESLKESSKSAEEILINQKDIAIFTNVIRGQIEFFHPEFKNFFASHMIISLINRNIMPINLLQNILSNRQYNGILEFLNFKVKDFLLTNLPLQSTSYRNPYFTILDNIIVHGHENLFLCIFHGFKTTSKVYELQHYFLRHRRYFEQPRRIFGMMHSTLPHPDPSPFDSSITSQVVSTPAELLVEQGMVRACHVLKSSGIWYASNREVHLGYLQDLLRKAVTRPMPNLELVKFFMKQITKTTRSLLNVQGSVDKSTIPNSVPLKTVQEHLNELLYHAVNEVGDGCQPILKYLVFCGAKPAALTPEGGTLLHVAVKWNNAKLVRFLVEKLRVPTHQRLDKFGRSLFVAALDANPSSLYTIPGWWKMMVYLNRATELKIIRPNRLTKDHEKCMIPKEDIDSPWFKLMVFNMDHIDTESNPIDARTIVIRTMETIQDSQEQLSALTRFIPSTSWRLSPATLALRRILFIQQFSAQDNKLLSPLELYANYRGAGELSLLENEYYQSLIKYLFSQMTVNLGMESQSRITSVLADNIASKWDCDFFNQLMKRSLNQGVPYDIVRNALQKVTLRLEYTAGIAIAGEYHNKKLSLPLPDRLLQSRSDYSPMIHGSEDIDPELLDITVLQRQVFDAQSPEINPVDAVPCLSSRNTRDIRFLKICRFSWKDVDAFNDAIERRVLAQIRINSDKFLQTLAVLEYSNRPKALQLVSLVRQLTNGHSDTIIVIGKSRMIVQDILQHGSLIDYRQRQRTTDIINDLWRPQLGSKLKRTFPLLSRSVALYAASSIPIIRGLYLTINICLQQQDVIDDKSCWISSGTLALSVALPVIGTVAVKYMPWIVNQISHTALDIIPSTAPRILRDNVKLMRQVGLKYGAKAVTASLGMVGIGLDLYNIVEMSKLIDTCSRQVNGCPSKDKVDYIISLSFSCISIAVTGGLMISGVGFVAGVLIGLGFLALELLALGINDVVYYSSTYNTNVDENFRIFFHKIGAQPPPADVQALARRTDWINYLQQRGIELLETSDVNIVAYGVGLGKMRNNSIIGGKVSINMEVADEKNTQGLSRVIPTAMNNTTLLCLPRQDIHEVYDKYTNSESDAVYSCDNAFVIAHEQRWRMRTSDKSYIVYDLKYADTGTVIGSNTVNNLFIIYNGTAELSVIGGCGNITNTFMMQEESFRGIIDLNRRSRRNILDLSRIKSPALLFGWDFRLHSGYVVFGIDDLDSFFLNTPSQLPPNLHVIGRTDQGDEFNCNYNKSHHLANDQLSITIDGGGGGSSSNMDHVIDCKTSIVRPFTNILGCNISDITYTTHIRLESIHSKVYNIVYATIQPQQSKFIVVFDQFPVFGKSSYGLQYTPFDNTLTWHLWHSTSSLLLLSMEAYRSFHSTLKENITADEWNTGTINYMFIDNYSGSTIYPIINLPADGNSTITVRHFNVFTTINSSQLHYAFSRYHEISVHQKTEFYLVTKLSYSTTGQSFTFGSSINDRFYIDANSTFLFGGNGGDVYVLTRESPNYVWIENEADDDNVDTIVVPDTTCDALHAERGSLSFDCCDNSTYDVTLSCLVGTSPRIQVILRNYILDARHRHLQIYWREAAYILLPHDWTQEYRDDVDTKNNKTIELALFFSFNQEQQNTMMTLTSQDTYVVLHITEPANTLVAYRSQSNDIILAPKYLNGNSSAFIVLKDFFPNNTKDVFTSTEWHHVRIFIVNNMNDDTIPSTLTAIDILNLFYDTLFSNATYSQVNNTDLIKEYMVNMTDSSTNNTMVIEHNDNSILNRDYRLGILTVTGANPGEFHAEWDRHYNTSLSLCARKTCIIIKNWCQAIHHRIYRIEFIITLLIRPIVIGDLEQLECQQADNTDNHEQLIKQINDKFSAAQKQLLFTDDNDDNDEARLMRCIGSIIADSLTHKAMYRLFGFGSIIHRLSFTRDNCYLLFTQENLDKLSLVAMQTMLRNTIEIFQLNDIVTQEEQKSILLLRKSIDQLDSECWHAFKSSLLYDHNNATGGDANFTSLSSSGLLSIEYTLDMCKYQEK